MKIFCSLLLVSLISGGCASHRVVMPTMDLPPAPKKPAIQAVTVKQGNDFLVGYTVPDALRLYQFLLEQDAYAEKLKDRVGVMNQIIKEK